MSNLTQKQRKDTSFSYGAWGWSTIIMCMIAYFIAGGVGTDGLNIYVGALSGLRGWDRSSMLAFSTYGGWIGVVVTFILGHLTAKRMSWTKPIMIVTTLLTAVCMFFYGHTTNFYVFGLCVMGVSFLSVGYSQVCANNIQTNFFPRRKAIVLGISTIGYPLCTMIWPFVCNLLLGIGVETMFTILALFIAAFGIAQIWWCKVTPEEVGAAPDNDPMSKEEIAASMKAMREYKSPWTMKKLVCEPRTWLIGIGLGLMWMVTVAIVSQLVYRLMTAMAMEQTAAVSMLSVVGFFGIFGSYLWGWIDQKVGTKKASLIYCVWYIVALIFLIAMQTPVLMYIGVFMVGISVGGICNLIPSLIGTVFGRKDFAAANRFISALTKLIQACAYLYMGKMMATSAGMTGAYIGLIVISAVAFVLIALIKPFKTAEAA